jgi:hypothetical protein
VESSPNAPRLTGRAEIVMPFSGDTETS